MPEVSLVSILDADQEGFLRSDRSLIQTIGRAARHANGMAVLYADRITGSMQRAIDETDRRRKMQDEHNRANNIVPRGVVKSIQDIRFITRVADARIEQRPAAETQTPRQKAAAAGRSKEDLQVLVKELEVAMREAATALDFEAAARLRDQLFEVRTALGDKPAQARGADAVARRAPGTAPMRPAGRRR
jgi:excinuclease ABC subunit B